MSGTEGVILNINFAVLYNDIMNSYSTEFESPILKVLSV